MTANPFADHIATLPAPAHRIDTPVIGGPAQWHRAPFSVHGATDRQITLITDLLVTRDLAAETRPKYQARMVALRHGPLTALAELTAAQAGALITALLALPRSVTPEAETTDVPAGLYAYTGTEGHTVFVKVDRPTEGRWAGRTFVKLQLSDDLVRMPMNAQRAALRSIADAGVRESSVRYGHELGVCGVCGRTLTKEASRAAGIGPKCAAGAGW
jgi:hypothetical protein